jgi:hypothetical protein
MEKINEKKQNLIKYYQLKHEKNESQYLKRKWNHKYYHQIPNLYKNIQKFDYLKIKKIRLK